MPHFFTLQLLNPWQEPDIRLKGLTAGLSPALHSALICTGSLTRHLENMLKQTVDVQIIHQDSQSDWEHNPTLWSKQHTLVAKKGVTMRSAWLQAGGENIIFAHSQLAIDNLSSSTRQAIKEGKLPLGSLLLQGENAIERQQLELAQAMIPDLADKIDGDKNRVFWCRRSLFLVNGAVSARIIEIFLTDLVPDIS
jgi:chorismate-pyruvate lyase